MIEISLRDSKKVADAVEWLDENGKRYVPMSEMRKHFKQDKYPLSSGYSLRKDEDLDGYWTGYNEVFLFFDDERNLATLFKLTWG